MNYPESWSRTVALAAAGLNQEQIAERLDTSRQKVSAYQEQVRELAQDHEDGPETFVRDLLTPDVDEDEPE